MHFFLVLLSASGYLMGQQDETLPLPLGIGNKWVSSGIMNGPVPVPTYMYEHIDTSYIIDSVSYNVFRYTSPAGVEMRYGRIRWDGYHVVRLEVVGLSDPNKEWRYFKGNPQHGDTWTTYIYPNTYTSTLGGPFFGTFAGEDYTYYRVGIVKTVPTPIPQPAVFYSIKFGLKQYDINSTSRRRLLGAYINGVLYGDTTFYTYVSVKDAAEDIGYTLEQNYPNPFNPNTTIAYSLEKPGEVKLVMYDCLGNEVKEMVNQYKQQGRHTAEVNGNGLSSGVYFYVLQVNGHTLRKSFVLLK